MQRAKTHSKMGHIREEDVDLDNLGQIRPSSLDDSLHVLAALGREFADGAGQEGALRGEGDLARAVNCRRGLDGLGLKERFV